MSMKNKSQPQFVTVAGKRLVVLEAAEFERLTRKADLWEPILPQVDSEGNYPAQQALGRLVARKLLRRRRALGLTQKELARRAGIRPETFNRIEQGKHEPSV